MAAPSAKRLPPILAPSEEDLTMMLAAQTHLGSKQCIKGMEPYVYKRRPDGINVINLGMTYSKIVLAARLLVTISPPSDIVAISSRPYGHRAVLKFAVHTGAQAIAGRIVGGGFTNYITKAFREPRVIVVTDPRVDGQAIRESSYVNLPVIGICDTDADLQFVDVAIPANNKSRHSIGLIWWLLAREVLRLRGSLPRAEPWPVMVDMFFYRDPEEVEREEAEKRALAAGDAAGPGGAAAAPDAGFGGFGDADGGGGWEVEGAVNPGLVAGASAVPGNTDTGLDWAADAGTTDWTATGAAPAAPAASGGGGGDGGWGAGGGWDSKGGDAGPGTGWGA